jgi:hypothetical protein
VGSKIEGRLLPQRWVVVGVAPEERAETARVPEPLQRRGRVCSRRFFVDQRRRAGPLLVRLVTAAGRETELAEQDVATVAEPTGHAGQEREQFSVGCTVRPARVDRVAVHREEIARLGSFLRPEAAILFQVFHVQTDRDERRLVGRADRRAEPGKPGACR